MPRIVRLRRRVVNPLTAPGRFARYGFLPGPALSRSAVLPGVRRANPGLMVTLGAVNPRRRRKRNVARVSVHGTRRRSNARAATRRARAWVRANPVRRRKRARKASVQLVPAVVRANPIRRRRVRYRYNPVRSRRVLRYFARRKNPRIFGAQRSTGEVVYMVLGALAGMVSTKFLPTMFPRFSNTNLGRTLTSLVSAVLTYLVAGALLKDGKNEYIADSVLLGGLIQTGSVALNAFLPGAARQVGLAGGLGAFQPAQFPVPQNPILAAASERPVLPAAVPPATAQKMGSSSGIGRAFGSAF